MKLDELNMAIIKHLRDGRRSFAEIADELSVTTNTVRSRVNKLIDNGVLAIQGAVDPDEVSGHFMVLIGIKLSAPKLVEIGGKFGKLKGVVSVAVVTGRFDLILTVLLNDEFGLMEFYTHEVSKIEEVVSTETFVVYKNYGWKLPYIL